MNRYLYTVEVDDEGNKVVHFYANIYLNDADETEYTHRIAEWTFLYFDLPELDAALKNNTLYDQLNEAVAYIGDLTENEAKKACDEYFDGYPGNELYISQVNQETPFGEYWFDEA